MNFVPFRVDPFSEGDKTNFNMVAVLERVSFSLNPSFAWRPIKGIFAINVDLDQMPQNAAPDQGLHGLN